MGEEMTVSLMAKLAAIVVHADEMTGPDGHAFDAAALRSLVEDHEVVGWIRSLNYALLPVKRSVSVRRPLSEMPKHFLGKDATDDG